MVGGATIYIFIGVAAIYQFMPNGISFSYQLDQSISVLRVAGGILHFNSNFNRTFCEPNSGDPYQRLQNTASDLGLHCLCMSHKKES